MATAHCNRRRFKYEATGLQILELAQNAYSLYVAESAPEQARLVKMLLSNCAFDPRKSFSYLH